MTELRSQKMTEFMEENQEAEAEYSDDNTDNSHKLLNKKGPGGAATEAIRRGRVKSSRVPLAELLLSRSRYLHSYDL